MMNCTKSLRKAFFATATQAPDITIVGGGIIGTSLGCALASSPYTKSLKIALIEASDLSKDCTTIDSVYSNRVSSITPASSRFLTGLGAWGKLSATRTHPYHSMHVWDATYNGGVDFGSSSSSKVDQLPIAHIVENRLLKAALADRAKELGVAIYDKSKVDTIARTGNTIKLVLQGGDSLTTSLLIGADGIRSKVRTFAEIETVGYRYDQTGLVGTVKLDVVENNAAWQRFLPTGPMALLPVSKTHSSFVWSLKGDLAKKLASLDESKFVELLNGALQNPVQDVMFGLKNLEADLKEEMEWGKTRQNNGKVRNLEPPKVLEVVEGSRAPFPLQFQHATKYTAESCVLVGDAAHSIHPLAGQGLNLGLADVECLSKILIEAVKNGQDFTDATLLAEYASERYIQNSGMLMACDGMKRLFSNDIVGLARVRSMGLDLVNSLPFAKAAFIKLASS